jgi:hypothetical protein
MSADHKLEGTMGDVRALLSSSQRAPGSTDLHLAYKSMGSRYRMHHDLSSEMMEVCHDAT